MKQSSTINDATEAFVEARHHLSAFWLSARMLIDQAARSNIKIPANDGYTRMSDLAILLTHSFRCIIRDESNEAELGESNKRFPVLGDWLYEGMSAKEPLQQLYKSPLSHLHYDKIRERAWNTLKLLEAIKSAAAGSQCIVPKLDGAVMLLKNTCKLVPSYEFIDGRRTNLFDELSAARKSLKSRAKLDALVGEINDQGKVRLRVMSAMPNTAEAVQRKVELRSKTAADEKPKAGAFGTVNVELIAKQIAEDVKSVKPKARKFG